MSRSGYSDDGEYLNLYRASVERAISGKRGQKLLSELAQALDEMPVKALIPDSFTQADGEFCALGVLGKKRGVDLSQFGEWSDPEEVGKVFGISRSMAAEVMFINDEMMYYDDCENVYFDYKRVEICGPLSRRDAWKHGKPDSHTVYARTPVKNPNERRWSLVRRWVAENLKASRK